MKIPLLFPDFRRFVRNKAFNSETNEHPVFYFETEEGTYFYKPEGIILYYIYILNTDELPDGHTIKGLKQEFSAIEIKEQLARPKIIQTQGTIS